MEIVLLVVGVVLGLGVGVLAGRVLADRTAGERVRAAELRAVEATARLEAERRLGAERLAAAEEDRLRLLERFRSVAADALAANNEQFLGLAEQRLRAAGESADAALARRQEAVQRLVEPIAQVLDEVREQVRAAEEARTAGGAALVEQLRAVRESSDHLRAETGRLVTALRSSHVRGRWGELQLRRVVEAAGMLPHVDFVEQEEVRTADGVQRPDLVVHLAGGKHVVVDAKVALLAYLEAVDAEDEATRAERMRAHARHVRAHVDALAAKQYWAQFPTAPELVVMFVPAEAFLHAAVEADPTLYEYAMDRNVVLATPMTLVALLRTIAYGWRQEALAANAQKVLVLGRELHGRLATLGGHVSRLGNRLDGAVRAYNDAVASLESRVLVSARRLAELEVTDDEFETPAQVERTARHLQAPELVAGELDRLVALDDLLEREVARPHDDAPGADRPAAGA